MRTPETLQQHTVHQYRELNQSVMSVSQEKLRCVFKHLPLTPGAMENKTWFSGYGGLHTEINTWSIRLQEA